MPSKLQREATQRSLLEGVLLGFAFFCAAGCGIYLYYADIQATVKETLQRDIIRVSQAAAAVIDPEAHNLLRSQEQEDSEMYRHTVAPLRAIQQALPDVRFLYTMIREGDQLRFVLDATPTDKRSPDGALEHSKLMDPYENPAPGMFLAFESGKAVADEEPTTDEWGTLYSGYAPILDKAGKTIGIVGTDIDANTYYARLNEFRGTVPKVLILNVLLSFAAGIAGFYYRKNTRFAKILRDVSERKMSLALEQEKETNEMRTRLLGTVSHEFRGPLTVLTATCGFLRMQGPRLPEEKREKYLNDMHNACKRLEAMVEDVLMLSKSESGKLEFKPAPISLSEFLQDLCDRMKIISSRHNIQCTLSAEADHAWWLDEELLHHIFTNLITNAIKYSPKGGIIECIANVDKDGHLHISVRDQGIGIPDKNKAMLFQEFFRADNVGSIRGTGLGLPIIKQATELHGGKVTFDSVEGKGTTFTVTLPARSVEGEG
jgi:signal transduction histidine kinase